VGAEPPRDGLGNGRALISGNENSNYGCRACGCNFCIGIHYYIVGNSVKEVDLHGVRHRDVYAMLEKLCVAGDVPFIVITGKSAAMKTVVESAVAAFGLHAKEKLGNSGRLIISEESR
jgi:hypothetical protein